MAVQKRISGIFMGFTRNWFVLLHSPSLTLFPFFVPRAVAQMTPLNKRGEDFPSLREYNDYLDTRCAVSVEEYAAALAVSKGQQPQTNVDFAQSGPNYQCLGLAQTIQMDWVLTSPLR
ncbi:CDK-activating kinase assembly factor MAT1 [Striga asiatica]|uniref:CDK-activating kinase assembly factor MAT1 n=1 Tax=Striga asiatica TaxID=4170 RepID=A0A5A7Q0E2_STRAF|nr:CDK-activating kinase assembly factor MAT1 [Striga asiatica]